MIRRRWTTDTRYGGHVLRHPNGYMAARVSGAGWVVHALRLPSSLGAHVLGKGPEKGAKGRRLAIATLEAAGYVVEPARSRGRPATGQGASVTVYLDAELDEAVPREGRGAWVVEAVRERVEREGGGEP